MQHQQMPFRDRLDQIIIDPHQSVVVLPEKSTAEAVTPLVALDLNMDRTGKLVGRIDPRLADPDAILTRQVGRIHIIDQLTKHRA